VPERQAPARIVRVIEHAISSFSKRSSHISRWKLDGGRSPRRLDRVLALAAFSGGVEKLDVLAISASTWGSRPAFSFCIYLADDANDIYHGSKACDDIAIEIVGIEHKSFHFRVAVADVALRLAGAPMSLIRLLSQIP
jgi:hypothetical protein